MRQIGYALGFLLLLLAAAAAFAQLLMFWAAGAFEPVSLGKIWYNVNANSLVGFQGLVERGLGPWAWAPLRLLLSLPAFLVFAVPGFLLWFSCRPRSRAFG